MLERSLQEVEDAIIADTLMFPPYLLSGRAQRFLNSIRCDWQRQLAFRVTGFSLSGRMVIVTMSDEAGQNRRFSLPRWLFPPACDIGQQVTFQITCQPKPGETYSVHTERGA